MLHPGQMLNVSDPNAVQTTDVDQEAEEEITQPLQEAEQNQDFAIMIAFPDQTASVGNTTFGKLIDFNKDGQLPVGHAGIIIVNGLTGEANYFDFGRYNNRKSELGSRSKDQGIVRSHTTVGGLTLPVAQIENGVIVNVEEITQALNDSYHFGGSYGQLTYAVIDGLNYDAMLSFARGLENQGFIKFDCPHGQYCARFARQVARAGGASFAPWVFSGKQNVNSKKRN